MRSGIKELVRISAVKGSNSAHSNGSSRFWLAMLIPDPNTMSRGGKSLLLIWHCLVRCAGQRETIDMKQHTTACMHWTTLCYGEQH